MEKSLASKGRRTFLQPLIILGSTTLPSYEVMLVPLAWDWGSALSWITTAPELTAPGHLPLLHSSLTLGSKLSPFPQQDLLWTNQFINCCQRRFLNLLQYFSCLIHFPIANTFDPSSREGACTEEALKAFLCVCRWPKQNHP